MVTLRVALTPAHDLDQGIRAFVDVFREHGVETFESCDGSAGHSYAEPTVRFSGQRDEGFRALIAVSLEHGFPVDCLRRFWDVIEGEPRGPCWEITMRRG